MESKCSECGKTCGSNAHRNMRGEFAGQILCGLCYNAYKTDLETRWVSLYKEINELHSEQRNYTCCDPYDPIFFEHKRKFEQICQQVANLGKIVVETNKKYHNLTGTYMESLSSVWNR